MRFLKIFKKKSFYLLVGPCLLFVGFVIYQCWIFARPSTKAIQDYHLSWLDTPQQHGVSIEETSCLDGKIPTLIVTPSPKLGERGETIREQLIDRACEVPLLSSLLEGNVTQTIVLLHGRNGRKEDLLAVAERFCAVGYRCILIDLPSHGDSPVKTVQFGASEWEQDIPYHVLLECADKYNFSPDKASLWGMSLGGCFANSALADEEHGSHWKKAVIVCSFDNLSGVIQDKVVSETMVDIMSTLTQKMGGAEVNRVTPVDWVTKVTTPVMVVHGTADSLISEERGKALYEAYASPNKRWISVEDGTHQNILVTPKPLYADMLEWLLES